MANNFNSDAPGTVSIINTATCNGTHAVGCHRHFPTVSAGRGPFAVALDARTGRVYMTAFSGAAVTILNGARCNATVTTGCGTVREQPVGSEPLGLAIDPDSHTVYVSNIFHGGSLSPFRTVGP